MGTEDRLTVEAGVFDEFRVAETSYGFRKRLRFLSRMLTEHVPTPEPRILDIGCGTGQLLAAPLGKLHPEAAINATDVHEASIAQAQREFANLRNVIFEHRLLDDYPNASFDVVICSEVLEHVHEVESFVASLIAKTAPGGLIVVTVPNGLGPFEIQSWLWQRLFENPVSERIIGALRNRRGDVRRAFLNRDSRHVNFFRFRPLLARMSRAGLELLEYEGRTFLAGPFVEMLMRVPGVLQLNNAAGTRLPPWAVSDWMFAFRVPGRASRPETNP